MEIEYYTSNCPYTMLEHIFHWIKGDILHVVHSAYLHQHLLFQFKFDNDPPSTVNTNSWCIGIITDSTPILSSQNVFVNLSSWVSHINWRSRHENVMDIQLRCSTTMPIKAHLLLSEGGFITIIASYTFIDNYKLNWLSCAILSIAANQIFIAIYKLNWLVVLITHNNNTPTISNQIKMYTCTRIIKDTRVARG